MIELYLNERSKMILNYLLQNNESDISTQELSTEYNISERSIRYDLEDIDDFLKENNISPLVRKQYVTVQLHEDMYSREVQSRMKLLLNRNEYIYSPFERQSIIFLQMALKEIQITLDNWTDILKVSRSTIQNDIRQLKRQLARDNISVFFKPRLGYSIKGNEIFIRRKIIEIISYGYPYQDVFHSIVSEARLKPVFTEIFEEMIETLEKDTGKVFSGEAFQNLVYAFSIVSIRIRKGFSLSDNIVSISSANKDYEAINLKLANIETNYELTYSDADILFLTEIFQESGLIKADEYLNEDWLDLHLLISKFIEDISRELQLELSNDKELFKALVLHLGPALKRMKNKVYLKNEILDYIQKNYSKLYHIIDESLTSLVQYTQINFTPDEIGYVTLHVASAYEKHLEKDNSLNVILVCNSGLGTTKILQTQMIKKFSFNIVSTYSLREIKERSLTYTKNIDLIISTVNLKENLGIPIVEVSPLLTEQEIQFLKKIEKNHVIDSSQQLVRESRKKGDDAPVLKEVLTEDLIDLKVKVDNWEDAIQKGGELLLNKGVIQPEYIKAMIQSAKDLGPYIVIAPHIAMPHASPENGVNNIGISLMTLEQPINFGHKENDPVELVLCLAAVDHSTHLKALQSLVSYLSDEKFLELVKNAKTSKEVLSYITE